MRDNLDDINFRLLSIGLNDRKTKRSNPADWIACLADDVGTCSKPFFYLMSAREKIGNRLKRKLCNVQTRLVSLILTQEILVPQLSVNLFSGSNEGHSVNTSHHSLLDCLSLDVIWQFFG